MNKQGKVWGETSDIFNKNNVEIHVVNIKKGGYCSKHKHLFKFNRFVMLSGKLKVTIWKNYNNGCSLEDVTVIKQGEQCTVPPNEYHRFEALEDCTALEIYWCELNGADIVRLDIGGIYEAQADQPSKATGSDGAQASAPCYNIGDGGKERGVYFTD